MNIETISIFIDLFALLFNFLGFLAAFIMLILVFFRLIKSIKFSEFSLIFIEHKEVVILQDELSKINLEIIELSENNEKKLTTLNIKRKVAEENFLNALDRLCLILIHWGNQKIWKLEYGDWIYSIIKSPALTELYGPKTKWTNVIKIMNKWGYLDY